MSNLKKVTALSLALVSVLGTIASATFADQSDIDATDAVDTLSALGIINGYTDGTFRPEGTVTRAEMAKMIFTIKNGGNDDASAFAGISSSFTDIKGHWAEGYIKYCQTQGIIAGKSATTFAPDQKVTGTEALKMALTVLGYRADKSGLTGSAWATNTLALASERGLTADYGQSFSAASQRQNAAQVLYNALYADVVKYSAMFDEYEIQDKMLAEKDMNLETKTAVLGEGKTITLTVDGSSVEVKLNKDSSAYIGQHVEVLFNKTKKQAYGVKPTSNNIAVSGTKASITKSALTDAGFTATQADTILGNTKIASAKAHDTVYVAARKGGADTVITVIATQVRTVTSVNADRVLAGAEYKFEDKNTIPAKIAKGDTVVVTEDKFTGGHKLAVLEKTTGDVTATKAGEVRVGTTWYKIGDNNTGLSIGNTVEFYVVNGYVFNAKATSVEVTNQDYMLVTKVATTTDTLADTIKAIATMADGTEKTITVSKIDGAKVTTGNVVADTLYSFEKDGDNYKLKTVTKETGTAPTFNEKNDTLNGMPILDDAVVFVKAGTTTKVLTGKTVAAWDTTSLNAGYSIVTKTVNGVSYVNVAFVNVTTIPGTSSDALAGLVVGSPYTVKVDGEEKTEVEIFNGTKVVTYRADSDKYNTSGDAITEGEYVTFKVNTDNVTISTIDKSAASPKAVKGINGNRIAFDKDDNTYTINDDTKIVYVNSKDGKGIESGEIIVADKDKNDQYINNVRVITNADFTVDTIYVDVNNEMQ